MRVSRNPQPLPGSWACQAAGTETVPAGGTLPPHTLAVMPYKSCMSFQKGQDSPGNLPNGVGAESSSVKARLAYTRVPPYQSWEG